MIPKERPQEDDPGVDEADNGAVPADCRKLNALKEDGGSGKQAQLEHEEDIIDTSRGGGPSS